MLNSPFDLNPSKPPKQPVPNGCDIIFVSDMFVEDYAGGAELTTEALIGHAKDFIIHKIKSEDLDLEDLEKGHQKYWIFGNFADMNYDLIPTIVANLNYSVLEYDYKYCKWRSPEKHEIQEQSPCDCNDSLQGKLIATFLYGSKSLWWMSEKQQERYHKLFPFLDEKESTVLSSVFDETFFVKLRELRLVREETKPSGWIVLGSPSWIKGYDAAIEWCEKNKKEYEAVWKLPYGELLEKLATAEGFVYLPQGGDTCPRMVIEAKLLGCDLQLNENVEHASEIWFDTDDIFDTEAYLYAARDRFWSTIKLHMAYSPTISGYTTTKDCVTQGYPWKQCIKSMLGFCDEVIVVDGGSTDGTIEQLKEWEALEPRLKVTVNERDWSDSRFAVFDGEQKAYARSLCSSEYCWQMDADEIVHEDDYTKVHDLVRNFPALIDLISLPVVEYWGGPSKVRIDVNPWKWRLSKNVDHITHGIPGAMRKTDENGKLYAAVGTDGCDYVHNETYEVIAHASFYTPDIDQLKQMVMSGNKEAYAQYSEWFKRVIELLPGVYHYSWYDLPRKISTYKNYWSKHWQSLYDITQEDTAENNMFFDKPWLEVTDADIESLSTKLASEMGGWVFHQRVDFTKPTPWLSLDNDQPAVMAEDITSIEFMVPSTEQHGITALVPDVGELLEASYVGDEDL